MRQAVLHLHTPTSLDPLLAAVEALAECHRFLTEDHQVLDHAPDWLRDPSRGGLDCERIAGVVRSAQGELREFYSHILALESLCGPKEEEERENDILICCALRFDCYRYMEVASFNSEQAILTALEGGQLPTDELQKLAMFFWLQRFLFKWGGEREPRNGQYWRLFRELFLGVARSRVPAEFRPEQDDCRLRWRYHYRPQLEDVLAFMRRIHQETSYRDHAVPTAQCE